MKMCDCAMGDTTLTPQDVYGNNQADFQCQVGDSIHSHRGEGEIALDLYEMPTSHDFQCQACAFTCDFQCQAKNATFDVHTQYKLATADVHCQAQNMTSNVHCQAEMTDSSLRNAKDKIIEDSVKTVSSASQCDLISEASCKSVDFQCQAGVAGICSNTPTVKSSKSFDFTCQVGATQSDFTCQFNDNINA